MTSVGFSFLSSDEKRLVLAQIVRADLLDCFDDSGAFDLARARRVLPPCALQELYVQETTVTDPQGNVTVKRTTRVRLANRLRALRLDDLLFRRQEDERDETRSLALRKKHRAAEDGRLRQRIQEIEELGRQHQAEAEIRAMRAEENRRVAERLRAAGCVGYTASSDPPQDQPFPQPLFSPFPPVPTASAALLSPSPQPALSPVPPAQDSPLHPLFSSLKGKGCGRSLNQVIFSSNSTCLPAMFRFSGQPGKDLCDRHLGISRRDVLRVGGAGMIGMTLNEIFRAQALGAGVTGSMPPGWGKAKNMVMIYLQGGPSHLDLWDPKENVPDKVRSAFSNISTKVPGKKFTEILPRLAKVNDKFTMINSMSYTPNGLFNHTAAIYQIMTGYTTDKVSPSGQLEPPSPKDFPNFGSNIIRLKPLDEPMLPFVMLPRPLQESNVIGKGGSAGFLGKGYDPYTLYPEGDDLDMAKMNRIKIEDLQLRPDLFSVRLKRRAKLRDAIDAQMPAIEAAVKDYSLDEYYNRALNLIASGRARDAFSLDSETEKVRDDYGRNTFGQSLLLARRLVEAGTRVVEVIWPKVANSDNHSWDHHVGLTERMKTKSGPMLDQGLSAFFADMDSRGLLDETLVVAIGEFGRSPEKGVSTSGNGNSADGRDHWPYCYTSIIAGAGIKRGYVHGKSDKTGSQPLENPVHPSEILATIYHAFGISPDTIVYNHLNQPRELVKAKAVTELFA